MRHLTKTALTAALATLLLGSLAACGEDEKAAADPDAPQEVQLGEEFSWNGFTVPAGWSVATEQQMMGLDEVTKPLIEAEVTNTDGEERFALFELVFAAEGEPVSTIHCNSFEKLAEGDTGALRCDGIGQPVPSDYDRIVVQPITR